VIPYTPSALIATASAFAGLGELGRCAPSGSPVDCFLRQVHPERSASDPVVRWDSAFIHHVGFWSHFDQALGSSSWPVPPFADPMALAEFARKQRVLVERALPGDLFLLWGPGRRRFVKAGIVVEVKEVIQHAHFRTTLDCLTIAGDSDFVLGERGGRALRHRQNFSAKRGDRFVRWTDLKRQAVPVVALGPAEEDTGSMEIA
jgi:hypothetical protein